LLSRFLQSCGIGAEGPEGKNAVQNLLSLWSALSLQRRIVVIGATLAMFMAVLTLGRMSSSPTMTLLYAGLDGKTAGEVVAALDQQGAAYEVRGTAIYVADTARDSLRMTLAGQGLPAAGSTGYELLDGMSGFGTTSQMFDAAYWRAKEGELARTILSNPQVRAARVHIAAAPDAPFQPDQRPSASITVTSVSGALGTDQARALRHLVAAAVPGLLPKDVALIDSVSGLIPFDENDPMMGQDPNDRAATLRANLERLLEARVGPGRAIVKVSLDVNTEQEQITERVFDPQGRLQPARWRCGCRAVRTKPILRNARTRELRSLRNTARDSARARGLAQDQRGRTGRCGHGHGGGWHADRRTPQRRRTGHLARTGRVGRGTG
jgi:flagellar M-ring protein FliF